MAAFLYLFYVKVPIDDGWMNPYVLKFTSISHDTNHYLVSSCQLRLSCQDYGLLRVSQEWHERSGFGSLDFGSQVSVLGSLSGS